MAQLTDEQVKLLLAIESDLRRECALAFIANGYENKKQSYINACKNLGKNPSKNPDVSGAEILGYPSVTAFIDSVRLRAAEVTQTDANYLLKRLREIDELDIIDIVNEEMTDFRPLKDWPKSWRTSISGIDLQTILGGGDDPIDKVIKKIKWPDKVKNLEMIGKHNEVAAWQQEKDENKDDDLAGALNKLIDRLPN